MIQERLVLVDLIFFDVVEWSFPSLSDSILYDRVQIRVNNIHALLNDEMRREPASCLLIHTFVLSPKISNRGQAQLTRTREATIC
jgi:hypothetical protein